MKISTFTVSEWIEWTLRIRSTNNRSMVSCYKPSLGVALFRLHAASWFVKVSVGQITLLLPINSSSGTINWKSFVVKLGSNHLRKYMLVSIHNEHILWESVLLVLADWENYPTMKISRFMVVLYCRLVDGFLLVPNPVWMACWTSLTPMTWHLWTGRNILRSQTLPGTPQVDMLYHLSAIGLKRLNLRISFSSEGVVWLSCRITCTDRHRVHRVVISGQVAVS